MANLTVSEAAAELGTTQPRLRRLLVRPDFAGRTQTETRETKTGTRTATVVPVSVLDDLRAALEAAPVREQKQEREQSPHHALPPSEKASRDQEREQERGPAAAFSFPADVEESDQLSPLAARLVGEMEARIADLKEQNERLASALQREQEGRARDQALRALLPPVESDAEKKSGLGGASVGNESPLRARLKVRLGHV